MALRPTEQKLALSVPSRPQCLITPRKATQEANRKSDREAEARVSREEDGTQVHRRMHGFDLQTGGRGVGGVGARSVSLKVLLVRRDAMGL